MTGVWLHIALGAVTFWCQDLPGLRATFVKDAIGRAVLNCRQADLDGDGALDLIFPNEVVFQRDGGFPEEARHPLPRYPDRHALDVWGDMIFYHLATGLVVFQWRDDDWRMMLKQDMPWPVVEHPLGWTARLEEELPATRVFQRFLHDFDDDGFPEIVAVNEEGVHVYKHNDEAYVFCGYLSILPPLRMAQMPPQRVWPQAARRIALPARHMACRLFMDGPRISILQRDDAPDMTAARHRQFTYRVFLDENCAPTTAAPQEQVSENIPGHMRPCYLKNTTASLVHPDISEDKMVDFAGGRWEISRGGPYPKTIYETWATLDGGKTFHVRRAPAMPSFRPHTSFVDFDGDGLLDMVVESLLLTEGGWWDTAVRVLSRRSVDSRLSVYRQTAGGFAQEPTLQFRTRIHLTRPPVFNDLMYQRYRAGELISITGDFNANGWRDLAVRDRPDRIAVHLAAGFAYSVKPSAVIPVRDEEHFIIADVNGDGLSDVVLQTVQYREGKRFEGCRVCFAMEEAP